MDTTDERWDLLAEHVVLRRLELGMTTQQQLAVKSGISATIIGRIERATYRPGNSIGILARLQQALGWDVGSVKSILEGGRPAPLAPTG